MSVQENLMMGAYARKNSHMIKDDLDYVLKLFPRLQERRAQLAGTLSGGEQQMLAMGRAMMGNPKVLLMDEPSMGLAPVLVEVIFDSIELLNKQRGITVLLVEQNAQMALGIANRAYVLETGKITMAGDAKEMLHDEKVISAYLGL
jgi:branched-chain amino acid transport system ATP-binding protein